MARGGNRKEAVGEGESSHAGFLPFKCWPDSVQTSPLRASQPRPDIQLIIEAEKKTRAEPGHHNCHCSGKANLILKSSETPPKKHKQAVCDRLSGPPEH